MEFWFDANLSPKIAEWTAATFSVTTRHMDALGFRTTRDLEIFEAARTQRGVVVVTKDADFVELLERNGPPPAVLWLTTGNTSNAALKALFTARFAAALALFAHGDSLVEMR